MINKATSFEFTSYTFIPENKQVVFYYATKFADEKAMIWAETVTLPEIPNMGHVSKEAINKLLQSLHIILGISYYKFHCAPKIELPYPLSKKEIDFWNTVYQKGLGEFFYKNNLDPNISPKFSFSKENSQKDAEINADRRGSDFRVIPREIPRNSAIPTKILVGVGGGKDSIVAAELLKEKEFDFTSFNVETGKPSKIVDDIIKIINVGELKIRRLLDGKVHEKHQYNGHIPISAIYAFLGIFACVLYKYNYFIVSNEHSSNFGNIQYKGLDVNHQWSKSFEFEMLFSDYLSHFISRDVGYFSLLRPFHEIRIVKMFADLGEKYSPYFSSCNSNFRVIPETGVPAKPATLASGRELPRDSATLWCGKCPKCVFVFTLLSAYLSKKNLLNIFKKNLYEREELLPLFKDVLGFGNMKPFDCVGTFEEAQTALFLAKNSAV